MPSVEADVSQDSSVESDSGGDNPQGEENVGDASTDDCVGDNDMGIFFSGKYDIVCSCRKTVLCLHLCRESDIKKRKSRPT